MSSSNLRARWLLAVTITSCSGTGFFAASLWWTWPKQPYYQPVKGSETQASTVKNRILTGNPALWEHLSFSTPQSAPPVASDKPVREIRLVGIFPRRGKTVAALEVGKGSPLAFLAVGESRDGVKVLTIDGKRVVVNVDGTSRRLGDQP